MKWVETDNAGWVNLDKAFQVRVTKHPELEEFFVEIVILEGDKFYNCVWKSGFDTHAVASEWLSPNIR